MSEAMKQPQNDPAWGPPLGEADAPAPVSNPQDPGSPGGAESSRSTAEPPPAPPAHANTVVSYCRVCGRGLTAAESITEHGAVYCAEHAPVHRASQAPVGTTSTAYPPPRAWSPYDEPASSASPALAFLLGLIPGVGAVYNAIRETIVHVVIFGLLISIVSSGSAPGLEPMFGLLIGIWYIYMPFEAYHTAKKRAAGLPVDDISSLFPMRARNTGFPIGPIALIVLGVVFLLAQFDLISFGALLRYWPVLLIAAGAWKLYERVASRHPQP
ncbi:MAG: DUF5668 domain-containing protein [Bryobacterales bacterium]|nr:DUF5668 domain-containing protein [Bryobacterales bacterium]